MWRLNRLRLTNWYSFKDDTTDDFINDIALFGDSGCGKSTIADAIQFIFTCDDKGFNSTIKKDGKAINTKQKRNLKTYTLWQTDAGYQRKAPTISYILSEWYSTALNTYMIWGVQITTLNETDRPEVLFFYVENSRLEDILISRDNGDSRIYFNSADLLKMNSNITAHYESMSSAQAALKSIFGELNSQYVNIFKKGKSIPTDFSVERFLKEHILEESVIDVDTLRGELDYIHHIKKEVDSIEKEKQLLSELKVTYDTCMSEIREELVESRKLTCYSILSSQDQIEKNNLTLNKYEEKEKELNNSISKLESELESVGLSLFSLNNNYEKHPIKIMSNSINNQLKEIENKLSMVKNNVIKYENFYADLKESFPSWKNIIDCKFSLPEIHEFEKLKTIKDAFTGKITSLYLEQGALSEKISKVYGEINKTSSCIKTLEEGKRIYSDVTKKYLNELEKQNIKAQVLCEMIQITDISWQNAIEGVLGYDRYAIVVNPSKVEMALTILMNLEQENDISTIRLLDTRNLVSLYKNRSVTGTLAEYITSSSDIAKAYCNYRLGEWVCTDDISKITKGKGITKDCFMYTRHSLTKMSSKAYSIKYIGPDTIKEQLKNEKNRLSLLVEEKRNHETRFNTLTGSINELKSICFDNLNFYESYSSNVQLKKDKEEFEKKLFEIENCDELKEFNQALIQLETKQAELNSQKQILNEELKKITKQESNVEEAIKKEKEQKNSFINQYRTFGEIDDLFYKECEESFKKEKISDSKLNEMYSELEKKRNKITNCKEIVIPNLMKQYREGRKQGYEWRPELSNIDTYINELQKLEFNYTDLCVKLNDAEINAEQKMYSVVFGKLYTNIKTIEEILDETINNALKDLPIKNICYKFISGKTKNPKYKLFYDLLTDENLSPDHAGINGLFAGEFIERHPFEYSQFVSIIQTANENELRDYLDYRNYVDFDIRLTNVVNGSSTRLSDSEMKKSGGETLVYSYIIMIASFINVYHMRSSAKFKTESPGLVIWDEVFHGADEVLIRSIMELLKSVGLQSIFITQTPHIKPIVPYTSNHITITKDEEFGYTYLRSGRIDTTSGIFIE